MKLDKTETYLRTNNSFTRIGPVEIETPRGKCVAHDAPGLISMEIRGDGDVIISAAIMIYEPEPGHGIGFINQMSADSARSLAASLLRIADLMEPPALNS